MSKHTNRNMRKEVDEAKSNIDITTIFAVGVSDYEYLRPLSGPSLDLRIIRSIFVEDPATNLYNENQLIQIENPSSSELRKELLNFADKRRSRGDIVIFYFSGHGSVLGGREFVLCTKDSRFNNSLEGGGILSTSSVLFKDIVYTFLSVDVIPIFILDSCFSSTVALADNIQLDQINQIVQNDAFIFGNMYTMLCSSSTDVESKDTPEGGLFTIRLFEAIQNGINSVYYRNKPLLNISDITIPLTERLSKDGYALPRSFFGPQVPQIAICKNTGYQPETETFPASYCKIIEYIWNEGNPREVLIDELGNKLGRGVYSNHSKLSLQPWGLLEDGQSIKHRKLTERGKLFALGRLAVPKKIMKDPNTWEWIPDPKSGLIFIKDI